MFQSYLKHHARSFSGGRGQTGAFLGMKPFCSYLEQRWTTLKDEAGQNFAKSPRKWEKKKIEWENRKKERVRANSMFQVKWETNLHQISESVSQKDSELWFTFTIMNLFTSGSTWQVSSVRNTRGFEGVGLLQLTHHIFLSKTKKKLSDIIVTNGH